LLFESDFYIITMRMKKITVNLKERSYPIFIGEKLETLGGYLKKRFGPAKVFVVTNPKIKKLYFARLNQGLKKNGFEVSAGVMPDGERFKTLETVKKLYGLALKARLERNSIVIALGGGVAGDVAGFFAATYLRGLPLVQAPTTLLAMVDSSVGGKTGVDLAQGKNLVGAFYQPKAVWIDPSTLKTLPKRHVTNGMAEIIKYGIIKDKGFFELLEKNLDPVKEISPKVFEKMILGSCKIKAAVVSKDEREEKGLREILNFGHTFGHAIETLGNYKRFLHGEAVSMGMSIAARMAVRLGLLDGASLERIENLIEKIGLPSQVPQDIDPDRVFEVMGRDKKVRNGKARFVLPTDIGKVVIKSL
jgi:3-dehydroquinate synthase